MAVVVILIMASCGLRILGSGTDSTRTLVVPHQQSAFMMLFLKVKGSGTKAERRPVLPLAVEFSETIGRNGRWAGRPWSALRRFPGVA
jgi:hypothetical protein